MIIKRLKLKYMQTDSKDQKDQKGNEANTLLGKVICRICNGGWVKEYNWIDQKIYKFIKCPACKGSGYIPKI
jgi:hypothetical protein